VNIKIADLKDNIDKAISVSGKELWLEGIYADLKSQDNFVNPCISGDFVFVHRLAESRVRCSGHVVFSTKIDCYRCLNPIEWSTREEVFQELDYTDPTQDSSEYLEKLEIKLAKLICDTVLLAIPQQFKCEQSKSCLQLDEQRGSAPLWSA
jgi:uncharacterized metal-binding protein YceD (DUF177 family)